MLSVEECKQKLNEPFEEGRDRPARCYSHREAAMHRREAYRLFGALAESLREKHRPAADQPDTETDS